MLPTIFFMAMFMPSHHNPPQPEISRIIQVSPLTPEKQLETDRAPLYPINHSHE